MTVEVWVNEAMVAPSRRRHGTQWRQVLWWPTAWGNCGPDSFRMGSMCQRDARKKIGYGFKKATERYALFSS
jgi:hypothetical protein